MILTEEILTNNGFVNNHPERPLGKFYSSNPDGTYKIHVERMYIPETNKLAWMASAWNTNNGGIIIKRSSANYIETVEELQSVINLSNINLLIYYENNSK